MAKAKPQYHSLFESDFHENHSADIAKILKEVPSHDKDFITFEKVAKNLKRKKEDLENLFNYILTLTHFYGALSVETKSTIFKTKIKSKSEISDYFLKSLSRYFEKNLTFVGDWERKGVIGDMLMLPASLRGPQLVYLMEYRRTKELGDEIPIRKVDVSQCIIKARIDGVSDPVYLFQYDFKSYQYQLIGGMKRLGDKDDLSVMLKEIEEELDKNRYIYKKDFELEKLIDNFVFSELSNTFGAYSEYCFSIYHMKIKAEKGLTLGVSDKWVTLYEILNGKTKEGERIGGQYLLEVDKLIPGGLEELPLSIDLRTNNYHEDVDKSTNNLIQYIKEGENSKIEFKSTLRWDRRKNKINKDLYHPILRTLAGFSNSMGGVLLIGVEDSGEILGIEQDLNTLGKKNLDGYRLLLVELITEYLGVEHIENMRIDFEETPSGIVCIIHVRKAFKPVFLKTRNTKEFHVRIENSTKVLDSEEVHNYIKYHWN